MALDLSALQPFTDGKDERDNRIDSSNSSKGTWAHPLLRNRQRTGSSLERLRLGSLTGEPIRSEKPRKEENQKQKQMDRLELDIAALDDFITEFSNNKKNATALFGLLSKDFTSVANIIATKYYAPKYESAIESMNKVIMAMTTKLFATALLTVIKDNMIDNFDDVKTVFLKKFMHLFFSSLS